jgi:LysR family malonate utilization transcriptional regulator
LIPLAARYAISQHIVLVLQRNRERDPNLLALSAECRLLGAR